MNQIKLSVSLGSATLSFEGDPKEFREAVSFALEALQNRQADSKSADEDVRGFGQANSSRASALEMSMNSVVAKLGGNTCTELLKSAAVYLTLVMGKEKFTAREWDDAARESKSWKISYTKQKADRRLRLVKSGYVIENQKEVYSLSFDEVTRAGGLIGS
ncbi:hypothetical protein EPK99_17840 [Neorhizobium lilium]|uniref:Uncharacterized protein n=1 Tax=Neorhizobium lilium TaxID=2503024 RepID=A0A3S3RGX6_9HYPH|nr:hypothetical protein [Neorhizobium lilium]RWX75561.1 hypothetical protein EPK99_17840 [Neorhizobium lilium]